MSVLANITKGPVSKPHRMLIAGVAGVGKTTLAADAPAAVFIPAEEGCDELDVARLPVPKDWDTLIGYIKALLEEDHQYKSLVIDSLDAAEILNHMSVCKKARKPSIGEISYGRGAEMALTLWHRLARGLERLSSERSMNIILIAHVDAKAYHSPTSESWDRYQTRLAKSSAAFWQEWVDTHVFCSFVDKVKGGGGFGRARGIGAGQRMMHTQRCAAWDAKCRRPLPESLPMSWEAFQEAWDANKPAEPTKLISAIEKLRGEAANDDIRDKCVSAIEWAAGDAQKLAMALDRLRARQELALAENEDDTEAEEPQENAA